MNVLAIDIGNSRVKWALFSGNPADCNVLKHGAFHYSAENFEAALMHANLPVTSARLEISFVADQQLKSRLVNWLKNNKAGKINFAKTPARQGCVINSYQQPDKMGVDRWLAMIAGYHLQPLTPDKALCIIDCGTAITLDMLNFNGQHLGGLIMPGLHMMIKSLAGNTGKLPSFNFNPNTTPITEGLATTTESSIIKGCTQCIISGLFDSINHHQKNSPPPIKCIVTGGDGEWVATALNTLSPDTLQTSYNPYLVLQGLVFASSKTNPKVSPE